MSVAGEVTYLRRFAGKFVEIVAAGIGTAVSGYLVAYITGHISLSDVTEHLSFSKRAAVEATSPQVVSSAEPRDTASIEATVRAALASHDESRAASIVATPQPPTPASPETSAAAAAPPLDATEIKTLPVAVTVDSPHPAEPDGWPSDPRSMSGAGRLSVVGSRGLPPQLPPVNGNLFTALKHFF